MGLKISVKVLTLVCFSRYAQSAPSGFPQSGNGLWYTQPGVSWSKSYLPIGNGYLGGMDALPPPPTSVDSVLDN
jgi:Glycosyl hydrolase family 65, N-terminal domain